MSKDISVTWSEGVTEPEHTTLLETTTQVLRWLYMRHPACLENPPIQVKPFGNWAIPALVPDKPYWGAQWYVDASYDQELRYVIAPEFLELVRQEPWQRAEPHFDLALLDTPLTDFPAPLARLQRSHYCLGTSFPGMAAVMSVERLRTIESDELRALALARLVRHNLGHVFSVPPLTRTENVQRYGLELHCTNRCVMRHAQDVEELVVMTKEEHEMGWPFCPQCTRELHSVVIRYAQNWN